MRTRTLLWIGFSCLLSSGLWAQGTGCRFQPPFLVIDFGAGEVMEVQTASLSLYERVSSSCPTDGHYSFTSFTSDCFRGDWHTLTEDHTPGDQQGNMLLVNSAYNSGVFFRTRVQGFKSATTYRFRTWLMNVCRPSDKCPYPLLPNFTIQLQTPGGQTVARFVTGDVGRVPAPHWTPHQAVFTMPAGASELVLTMSNNAPGGCGNDFALDDISFQECVLPERPKSLAIKKELPVVKKPAPVQKEVKKQGPALNVARVVRGTATVVKTERALPRTDRPVLLPAPRASVPVPAVLRQRSTTVAREIETGPGEILLDLYDNGEIDGDTVSVYHNNRLVVSAQRLSRTPISFRLQVDQTQPRHELVLVAENLGSIPPNTSLMIVTAKDKRYQVFISSTEQQNAKVIVQLKE